MISLYCDGSSHAKGGLPGGWAFVIVRGEDEIIFAASGGDKATSNNIMELTAVQKGLEYLIANRPKDLIEIVSDSQYALGISSGRYTPSKNLELAEATRALAIQAGIFQFRWVKGHSGDTWNERVDSLAHDAKEALTPAKVLRRQVAQQNKKLRAQAKKKSA